MDIEIVQNKLKELEIQDDYSNEEHIRHFKKFLLLLWETLSSKNYNYIVRHFETYRPIFARHLDTHISCLDNIALHMIDLFLSIEPFDSCGIHQQFLCEIKSNLLEIISKPCIYQSVSDIVTSFICIYITLEKRINPFSTRPSDETLAQLWDAAFQNIIEFWKQPNKSDSFCIPLIEISMLAGSDFDNTFRDLLCIELDFMMYSGFCTAERKEKIEILACLMDTTWNNNEEIVNGKNTFDIMICLRDLYHHLVSCKHQKWEVFHKRYIRFTLIFLFS